MSQSFTKQGLARLKAELEQLKKVERRKIAQEINKAAGFGDLSENAAYKDAKEKKAFLEGRILELEKMLVNARIIEKTKTSQVKVGSDVSIETAGKKQKLTIVSSPEADLDRGRISFDSPLGRALLNQKIGDIIEIETPSGKMKYKITNVS